MGGAYKETRRGVDFERVREGLEGAGCRGLRTSINCVISGYNAERRGEVAALVQDLGFYATFEPVHRLEGIHEKEWAKLEVYGRALEDVLLGKEGYNCRIWQFLLHLEPDGTVLLPCGKYGRVGSVREMAMRALGYSEEA